jgi:tRNA threonylcarbamoyladenosine biosynthesis protein TsaE
MKETLTRYILRSPEETEDCSDRLAKRLKAGDVVALNGELGSGKSLVCRRIIKHFCGKDVNVPSPTFNLLNIYELESFSIYHYDLYRLKYVEEIYELCIEEALDGNLCLIEWPKIIEHILPRDKISLFIKKIEQGIREIDLYEPSSLA